HEHSTHGPGEAQHHHHRVGAAGPTPVQPASVLCLDHVQRGQTRDHHDAERQTEPRKPQRHTGQGEHDRDEYQRMHPPVLLVVVHVVFVVFVGLGTVAAEVVTEAVTATTPEPAQQTTTCFLVVVLLHLLGAVRAITVDGGEDVAELVGPQRGVEELRLRGLVLGLGDGALSLLRLLRVQHHRARRVLVVVGPAPGVDAHGPLRILWWATLFSRGDPIGASKFGQVIGGLVVAPTTRRGPMCALSTRRRRPRARGRVRATCGVRWPPTLTRTELVGQVGTGRTTRGSRTSRGGGPPRGGPTVTRAGRHRTLHRVPAGHTGGRTTLVLGPGQVEVEPARLGDQLCGGRTRGHVTGYR